MLREMCKRLRFNDPKVFLLWNKCYFHFRGTRVKDFLPNPGRPSVASTLRGTQTGNTEDAIWYNEFGK
jgi:hypothetical protein